MKKSILLLCTLILFSSKIKSAEVIEVVNKSDKKVLISNRNSGRNAIKSAGWPLFQNQYQEWFEVAPALKSEPTRTTAENFSISWGDAPYNQEMLLYVVESPSRVAQGHPIYFQQSSLAEFYNKGNRIFQVTSIRLPEKAKHVRTQPLAEKKSRYRLIITNDYSIALEDID